MANLALDTHRFVTDLKKAGMKTNQAEAVVSHISTALSEHTVTKAYLDQALDLATTKLWNKMLAMQAVLTVALAGVVVGANFALS